MNMEEQNPFSRSQMLFGPEGMEKLRNSRVAVFGIGGVGGYVVEALVRSGIGALDLIDHDKVSLSNLNRQLYATRSTIGKYKVDVAEERIHDINPDCLVTGRKAFFLPDTRDQFDFTQYDYVVDAIDTVAGKLALVEAARAANTPIICSMGAGNKTDPTAFRVADIFDTSVCPLARVMRTECRKRGIRHLKVVYSTEPPLRPLEGPEISQQEAGKRTARRDIPGSTAFVPSVAGLILAGEVVKDLLKGASAGRRNFVPLSAEYDAPLAALIRGRLKEHHLDIPGTAYYDESLDHLSEYYRQPGNAYFVLLAGGTLIGGIGLAAFGGLPDCCELQKLYLAKDAQGHGLGYDLIRFIENRAKRMGYRQIYLETHTNLQAAIHLYEKTGFREIARPESVIHSTMNRFYLKELS